MKNFEIETYDNLVELANHTYARVISIGEITGAFPQAKALEYCVGHAAVDAGFGDYDSIGLDPDSHRSGIDAYIPEIGCLAIKGNKVTDKSRDKDEFSISNNRTTSHKTLEEKIEFFNDQILDFMFVCIRDADEKHFRFFGINKIQLDHSGWKKIKGGGYKQETEFLDTKIVKNMSGQFWHTFKNWQDNPDIVLLGEYSFPNRISFNKDIVKRGEELNKLLIRANKLVKRFIQ